MLRRVNADSIEELVLKFFFYWGTASLVLFALVLCLSEESNIYIYIYSDLGS